MKARRTSPGLIENAISDKWIRQLAFFHLMKLRFTNSCIYNFRSRMDEISGLFGISTKTFYNHLNILRSKDLIFDHSTNLMLAKIKCRRKSLIEIDENYSLWDVTCLLYAKLIERKARQQAFKVSLRRFGRGEKLNSELCENPFHPSLSYRTIAKLLSISE